MLLLTKREYRDDLFLCLEHYVEQLSRPPLNDDDVPTFAGSGPAVDKQYLIDNIQQWAIKRKSHYVAPNDEEEERIRRWNKNWFTMLYFFILRIF
jgi:hypothetical protein